MMTGKEKSLKKLWVDKVCGHGLASVEKHHVGWMKFVVRFV